MAEASEHRERAAASEDMPVRHTILLLWRHRRLVAIVMFAFTLVAAIGSLFFEKQYKATVQFSVVSGEKGGAGGVLGQFSSIASLAGVSLGGDSQKFEALALLQSRSLTEQFMRDNDLLPILYPKAWDAVNHRWKSSDPKAIPTLWKAEILFRRIRTVVQDPKTQLVTLSITWRDPVLATNWANALVALTNKQMRDRAIADSERNIAYLRAQAAETQLVPVQTALSTLMEGEYRQAMMAGGNQDFALKVIDPAIVPELPSSLRRIFVALFGAAAGLIVASLFVLLRASWRGEH